MGRMPVPPQIKNEREGMALVSAKIVKILSDKALVINIGTKQDVSVGNIAHIIFAGEEVKDPENDKSLGKLEYVKGIVRVSHVQETMATCVPLGAPAAGGSSDLYRTVSSDMARFAMDRSPYGENAEALNIKSGDISGMPQIPAIGVGDTVVVIK